MCQRPTQDDLTELKKAFAPQLKSFRVDEETKFN
jgi:hypothetical protein